MANSGPLRLVSHSASCATLYAGQSFMQKSLVKQEDGRENIEEDLRAPLLQFTMMCSRCTCRIHSVLESITKVAEKQLQWLRQQAVLLQQQQPKPKAPSPEEGLLALPVGAPASAAENPSRPLPSPARAAALPRPVSTDAQPPEQRLWEDSFPATLPDNVVAEAAQDLGAQDPQKIDSDDDILIGDIDPVAKLHFIVYHLSPKNHACSLNHQLFNQG